MILLDFESSSREELAMCIVRRLLRISTIVLGLSLLPIHAEAFELTGIWATQSELCKFVFAKKGNQVVFSELSDLYGSGFIIEGNRITGKAAKCTITSRKQDGDVLQLGASCASTIMTQKVGFSLKVIDDNNISRVFPEVEGMTLKYTRCSF